MYIRCIPIVSLDKIYLKDNKYITFLDCTRLDGNSNLVSRRNVNDLNNVSKQVKHISNILKKNLQKYIILADDVVFSGSVLKSLIQEFKNNDICVLGIRSCISTIESYLYFNKILKFGLKCGYLLSSDVIDQICERDFYFGIAQSGILTMDSNYNLFKAPYFKPFGNPKERASIPSNYEKQFSYNCIDRSLNLWEKIEKNSNKKIYIRDLPEKINLTKDEEEVIKVLKKGKRLI